MLLVSNAHRPKTEKSQFEYQMKNFLIFLLNPFKKRKQCGNEQITMEIRSYQHNDRKENQQPSRAERCSVEKKGSAPEIIFKNRKKYFRSNDNADEKKCIH